MILNLLFKKNKKSHENVKSKLRFKDWMKLTKDERLQEDLKEKKERLRKKKALLKSIREEYIRLKKDLINIKEADKITKL